MGCRKRRSATNKIYAANHDSYPGATRTSGWLRSGAGQLDSQRSSSDSLLYLCQIFPGTEESLPIRNLEGTSFSLWKLHPPSLPIWKQASPHIRATMLSSPLLVYRCAGKQKEMWPRPVKDALLKNVFLHLERSINLEKAAHLHKLPAPAQEDQILKSPEPKHESQTSFPLLKSQWLLLLILAWVWSDINDVLPMQA